ncbi:MAG: hypothetical protein C0483_20035 [Pirellula sp.]|nr:hypothetical protein [Pirellula sp.]
MTTTLPEPTERVVLLGASNLTRGFATVLGLLKHHRSGPLDVLAALGNGRSYGIYARLLGRGLTGILSCGLWPALDRRPKLPLTALLTDIGNDVMYGVPVPQILAWVEECLVRLQKHDARIVVTGLPTTNLPRLGERRFLLLRTLLFPGNRDTLPDVTRRSQEVDAGVRELAARYAATFVEPDAHWYGIDPIHVRRHHWPTAWRQILTGLHSSAKRGPTTADNLPRVSFWNSLGTQFWIPEERFLLGLAQRRAQPCKTLVDGTRISIY